MVEYAILVSGSAATFFTDSMYKLSQWFGSNTAYWVGGGVLLFFLLMHFLMKKI